MTTSTASKPSPTQALIQRLRDRGLTQTEIARLTKIPQPRLSRWQNGVVSAGADDALRLQKLERELIAAAKRGPKANA